MRACVRTYGVWCGKQSLRRQKGGGDLKGQCLVHSAVCGSILALSLPLSLCRSLSLPLPLSLPPPSRLEWGRKILISISADELISSHSPPPPNPRPFLQPLHPREPRLFLLSARSIFCTHRIKIRQHFVKNPRGD